MVNGILPTWLLSPVFFSFTSLSISLYIYVMKAFFVCSRRQTNETKNKIGKIKPATTELKRIFVCVYLFFPFNFLFNRVYCVSFELTVCVWRKGKSKNGQKWSSSSSGNKCMVEVVYYKGVCVYYFSHRLFTVYRIYNFNSVFLVGRSVDSFIHSFNLCVFWSFYFLIHISNTITTYGCYYFVFHRQTFYVKKLFFSVKFLISSQWIIMII